MKRYLYPATLFGLLLICLAIAPDASGQSRKDKDQAQKFQADAEKAMAARKYAEAIDLFAKSLALVPENANVHYRKGFAHYSLEQYDQSARELTIALEQKHKPMDVYRVRYYVYGKLGNFDGALQDIEKAVAIEPNDVTLINDQAEFNYSKKAFPEALASFKRAATLAPDRGDIYYGIARVAKATGDVAGQAEAARIALDKGTNFPGESFYLLAEASQKLNKNAEAIDAYNRVLALKPKIYQVYAALSDIFKAESRFNDSIDILKKGLLSFPADGRFYTELGLVYSLAGRPADAVAASRSGVNALPNEATGYTNLCRALNETGEFAQAVIACQNSLRLRADDGETYFYLGNAFVGTKKAADATKAYASAVKGLVAATTKDPGQSDQWYLLGNSYYADKQFDKAIEAYLKCLEISPKFIKARANLGITYAKKKNKAAATEQYNLLAGVDASLAARVKREIDAM